jgi:hypothetical protein
VDGRRRWEAATGVGESTARRGTRRRWCEEAAQKGGGGVGGGDDTVGGGGGAIEVGRWRRGLGRAASKDSGFVGLTQLPNTHKLKNSVITL